MPCAGWTSVKRSICWRSRPRRAPATSSAPLRAQPVIVSGDRALLRRMMRNLIENAERHGAPPIEVEVGREGAQAAIIVSDRGAGVGSERSRACFLAVLPHPRRSGIVGNRARSDIGAADRTAARRRRAVGRDARAAEPDSGGAAVGVRAGVAEADRVSVWSSNARTCPEPIERQAAESSGSPKTRSERGVRRLLLAMHVARRACHGRPIATCASAAPRATGSDGRI